MGAGRVWRRFRGGRRELIGVLWKPCWRVVHGMLALSQGELLLLELNNFFIWS